jgi:hypothetical protein
VGDNRQDDPQNMQQDDSSAVIKLECQVIWERMANYSGVVL